MTLSNRQMAGVAVAGALIGLWVSPGRAYSDSDSTTLRPCKYEDSSNCFWDARKRGNGLGQSFVNLDGHLYYLGRRGANRAG